MILLTPFEVVLPKSTAASKRHRKAIGHAFSRLELVEKPQVAFAACWFPCSACGFILWMDEIRSHHEMKPWLKSCRLLVFAGESNHFNQHVLQGNHHTALGNPTLGIYREIHFVSELMDFAMATIHSGPSPEIYAYGLFRPFVYGKCPGPRKNDALKASNARCRKETNGTPQKPEAFARLTR